MLNVLSLILGNGYIQIGGRYIGNLEKSYLDLSITFATRRDGLLFWQGDKYNKFIRGGIKDGYLEFAASYGEGQEVFVSLLSCCADT